MRDAHMETMMNCQKASNLLGALVFGDVADAALEQAVAAFVARLR